MFKSSKKETRSGKIATLKTGKAKLKILKIFEEDQDKNKSLNVEDGMGLPRKIDMISFIVYFFGYCMFNLIYWIVMLSN